jgi:hypothetical protein
MAAAIRDQGHSSPSREVERRRETVAAWPTQEQVLHLD